ncbi:sigma-54-dependent Fis family transcriptional regulator [Sporomusa termitida]|uniref:Acetoin catabolism regulatory protein n=1 Tax=Sporomusa termitida TaxID=2377 RepID=A0A517DW85_9FIRM|nr:sigma-54-dependent Fis family transcriptional regulator [Sporomusa termitida]QDR81611.1 Acetoin catabolism regulatory protein [Sporomusa termitida]
MLRDKPTGLASKDLAWKAFIGKGKLERHIILPEIADSWVRCSQAGLNSDDGRAQNILAQADVRLLLEKNQDIINIAKPFMANIYEFFRDSGFIVVLADGNGYVMECFGDRDSLTSAKKLHFVRGASWREGDVGTNAIAIGLATGKPVQVSGAEHYCAKHHWWTCSAAPIYGVDGRIVAFLDLSGPAQAAYSHTLGMVAAAANAISMQIGMEQKKYELSLMNKHLSSIFNTMSEGVILFDRLGLVKEYNPIAKKLLGRSGALLPGASVQTIFTGNNQLIQQLLTGKETQIELEFQTGCAAGPNRCIISGESILDKQGCSNGGVIVLRPAEKRHSLISRASGYHTTFQFKSILGSSGAILEAVRQAAAAAVTASNVVLQGESGTGKEMFAQAIHNKSARSSGPFIALNCGAIPRELVASELFGYEEGAFTGAKRGGRAGKFELAAGGTLFLDEIGDMPLEQQVALLRVLQEKKVSRIGGNKLIPVDVRIICATNKDLSRLVKDGMFRQDLYYRLNVFKIEIPPLRQRQGDSELLFRNFVKQIGSEQGRVYTVDASVFALINRYNWPGNVRELHNAAERACNMAANGVISVSCFPTEICCPPMALNQVMTGNKAIKQGLLDYEIARIRALLATEGGNISRVAGILGIARSTLYRKIKRHSIH